MKYLLAVCVALLILLLAGCAENQYLQDRKPLPKEYKYYRKT
jgi:hypothetical protein